MKMMKRLLCIALAVLMVLAITACTPENTNPTTGNNNNDPTAASPTASMTSAARP